MMLPPLFSLENTVALVTGGTKGIGYAITENLLSLGSTVVLSARTERSVQTCVETLSTTYPDKVFGVTADVTVAADRKRLVAFIEERCEILHFLINNVGTNIRKEALAYTTEEIEHVFQTNLHSAYQLSVECHPLLKTAEGASIVNVSSVAGMTHLRTGVPYAMTKAAMHQMTRNLAVEWATDGIRVNAVAPWYIETPLAKQVLQNAAYRNEVLGRTPLQRIGQPAEVGATVAFLCTKGAGFITGQHLAVDGGFTVNGF